MVDKKGVGTQTLRILMEYCDEGPLDAKIAEVKSDSLTFAPSLVRQWTVQLAEALAHVHARRVIHRDLKTANVLLCTSPHDSDRTVAKLGDFGIARLMSTQTNFAATAVGTPYYLSPELITGAGYDGRADVWSLGIILYELLALERPFKGENIAMLAMANTRQTKP